MSEQIRISAKNLGSLALKNCCKRCFYLKLKLQFKLPFSIFPGIFSSIDSYSKKISWTYYEKFKKLPPWFDSYKFLKPLKVPHFSKFFIVDKETNVMLTGVPDEVFLNDNNSHSIIDYKTSRFTAHQDKLINMYKVQLNGYALIGERSRLFTPIDKLLLVYYEPHGGILEVDKLEEVMKEDGFNMPFSAHMLELELDAEGIVMPLLREVRRLWEKGEAPQGMNGCEDCRLLEKVYRINPI
jgi:hypothetical protein